MRVLVAFDFDHTIIDFNSDIIVERMIPKDAYTDEMKKMKMSSVWTDYMQLVFNILHENKVTPDEIMKVCEETEGTEGMIDLIKALKNELKAQIIIISDSNSVFIEHWLKSKNIYDMVDKIFTNPGKFNSDGLLEIQMYHVQDWCKYSTKNLCKSHVLQKYLEDEKEAQNVYDVVAYVGDGSNDLCPLLRLTRADHCFPRINYSLYKILTSNDEIRSQIKASIHPWSKGSEILDVLKGSSYP